jgi:hypothetical protein
VAGRHAFPHERRPQTINGKMLRALAKRDDQGFKHWRAEVNRSEEDKRNLYAMYYEAFREAAERRFRTDAELQGLIQFLAQPRVPLSRELDLPLSEAEALIRSALGETGLVDGIPGRTVVEVRMQLFVYLVEDLDLSDTELDELLATAEDWVAFERSGHQAGGQDGAI